MAKSLRDLTSNPVTTSLGGSHFTPPLIISLLRAVHIFESPTRTSRNSDNWDDVLLASPFFYITAKLSIASLIPREFSTFSFSLCKKNPFRVTNVLKTLRCIWVSTSHITLGKQTWLSRPNDAALCEAAIAAQAQLRTSMTNADVNVSLGYPTECQMPPVYLLWPLLRLDLCAPP